MIAALTLSGCSEQTESPVSAESLRQAHSADELEKIRENVREVCKTLASTDGLLTTFASYAQSAATQVEAELLQATPAKIRREKYFSATLDAFMPSLDHQFQMDGRAYHLRATLMNPDAAGANARLFGVTYDVEDFREHLVREGGRIVERYPTHLTIFKSDGTTENFPLPRTRQEAQQMQRRLDYPVFLITPTLTREAREQLNRETVDYLCKNTFKDYPFFDMNGKLVYEHLLKSEKFMEQVRKTQQSDKRASTDTSFTTQFIPPLEWIFANYRPIELVSMTIYYNYEWAYFPWRHQADGAAAEVCLHTAYAPNPYSKHPSFRWELMWENWENYVNTIIGLVPRESSAFADETMLFRAVEDDIDPAVANLGMPGFVSFLQDLLAIIVPSFNKNFQGYKLRTSLDNLKLTQKLADKGGKNVYTFTGLSFDMESGQWIPVQEIIETDYPGIFANDDVFVEGGVMSINERNITRRGFQVGQDIITPRSGDSQFKLRLRNWN